MSNFIVKYGLLSLLASLWAMGLGTYATIMMFMDITKIGAGAATAYSALLAVPGAAWAFYEWRNKKYVDSDTPNKPSK